MTSTIPVEDPEAILRGDVVPEGLVDFHSHLVPGVDDGARDLDEAVRAIGALATEGVRHVLTTPHVDASVILRPEIFERLQTEVEEAWFQVVDACIDREPRMTYHLGREIMLDTMTPDVRDPRVRLNGGRYVLVEFPRLTLPRGSEDALYLIANQGYFPVIAHVERYLYQEDPEPLWEEWRHAGAVFQVNAASVVGRYGKPARELAWKMLESGTVDLMASDYHARGRPWIGEARAELYAAGGEEQERQLFDLNPRRLLRGEKLVPVPPLLPRHGLWGRLKSALGLG